MSKWDDPDYTPLPPIVVLFLIIVLVLWALTPEANRNRSGAINILLMAVLLISKSLIIPDYIIS